MEKEFKSLSEKIRTAWDVDNEDWNNKQELCKSEDIKEVER